MGTPLQAAQDAASRAARASVPGMAKECQRLLGQRVVVFVTGHRSAKIVARWAAGDDKPQTDALDRLRALYRTLLILTPYEQPDTIRAWIVGSNPRLGDRAPIELLRDNDVVAVFKAAETFVDA